MPKSLSPLRYPGGKSKMVIELLPYMKNHKTLIEPFAGGAGVTLNFLNEKIIEKAILNDLDAGIYSFWKAILTDTDAFINKMHNTPVTPQEWKKQRDIYLSENNYSIDLGFAAFYLNRVCRSGILTAGIIGGNDQSGNYKMDCRFDKNNIEKKIRKIAAYKNQIEIYNQDINEFLINISDKDAMIYLDPPYYLKGKELYHKYFEKEEHEKLRDTLKNKVQNPWIMTYDNADEIKELYKNYKIKQFILNYSVNSKRKETELMILSQNIINPI